MSYQNVRKIWPKMRLEVFIKAVLIKKYVLESLKCQRTGPDDLQVMTYEVMNFYDNGKSCKL